MASHTSTKFPQRSEIRPPNTFASIQNSATVGNSTESHGSPKPTQRRATGESSAPRATAAAQRSSQLFTPLMLPSAYPSSPAE